MSKQEIEKRLEEIDNELWFIKMADFMTSRDFQATRELNAEKSKLLKELEG